MLVELEESYHPKSVAGTREGPGIRDARRWIERMLLRVGVRDRCSHDAAGHDVLESTVHGLGEAPYPTANLVADMIQKANHSVVLWRPLRRRHGDHAADRDPEQVLGSSFGGSGDLRLGISPA